MRFGFRRLALAAALVAVPLPARTQDVGLVAVHAVSDNQELPSPVGFGAEARFSFSEWQARLALVRYSDVTLRDGDVCILPGIACVVEDVTTSANFTGLRLELLRSVPVGGRLEVAAGGGASFGQIRGTSTGTSGRVSTLHFPNSAHTGLLGSVLLTTRPIRSLPGALVAGATSHWVYWNGCLELAGPRSGYAPFCGWDRITEVWAGITVTLPRR